MKGLFVGLFFLGAVAPTLDGQEWNSGEVTALVAAATARRNALLGSGGLVDYRARAHGFVLFLVQVGEGFPDPPRPVKVDQLELEVYWKSPNRSKQRIVGWRDQVEMPTDIRYHRDHLGIVQNNFGDRIRLGDGTEARDVVHPLSAAGPRMYDYAIVDSVSISMPGQNIEVYEVSVKPKEADLAAVIGSVFLAITDASVVRFNFSFTSAAYLDDDLEDITIVLDNGLWNGRFWLPRRQEIEIRRRSAVFDIPLRGIIRGHWELTDYEINVGLEDSLFAGREIVAATVAEREAFPWGNSLREAMEAADVFEPFLNIEDIRADLAAVAGGRLATGLPTARIGAGSVSELVSFNRVEGLSLGIGWSLRPRGGALAATILVRYGFDDREPQGRLSFSGVHGSSRFSIDARSLITDIGDAPVVSGVLGSLLAQEAGRDLGDYYRLQRLGVSFKNGRLGFDLSVRRTLGLTVRANPVTGVFSANPYLQTDWHPVARLSFRRMSPAHGLGDKSLGKVSIEAGVLDSDPYIRLLASFEQNQRFQDLEVRISGWFGLASDRLPAYRTFVLGGWGTLLGEKFRRWGGRQAFFGTLEVGRDLPFPGLPLGGFVTTGATLYMAPFISLGWTSDPPTGFEWRATGAVRVVAGVVFEPLNGFVRVMLGRNLSEKSFGLTIDVTRELWGVL